MGLLPPLGLAKLQNQHIKLRATALPPAQQTEDYLTGPLSQTPLTRVSGQDPPTFLTPATATQVTHLTQTGLTRIMCPLSHTTSNWEGTIGIVELTVFLNLILPNHLIHF